MTWLSRSSAAWGVVLVSVACSDAKKSCPPLSTTPPMTIERASTIAPEVLRGIAVSTTHVYGDCRVPPAPPEGEEPQRPMPVCPAFDPCQRVRAPLVVHIVPAGTSVPLSPGCDDEPSVEDLRGLTVFTGTASDSGELVAPLEQGAFSLFLSFDGQCTSCGAIGVAEACTAEVPLVGVVARNLVLDRASY